MGSIFRTADAAGVTNIILSGYTPTPLDRFKQPRKDFAKVSLGAEKTIPWKHAETLKEALSPLHTDGYECVAIEQAPGSVSVYDFKQKTNKIALVLGNEVEGLTQDELLLCDAIVEIPMRGTKESLNVSVAAGIVLFALLK